MTVNVKNFDVSKITISDEQSFGDLYYDNQMKWAQILYDGQPFILESDRLYSLNGLVNGNIILKCHKSNDVAHVINAVQNVIYTRYNPDLYGRKTSYVVGYVSRGLEIHPIVKKLNDAFNIYDLRIYDKDGNKITENVMDIIKQSEVIAKFNMSRLLISQNRTFNNQVQLMELKIVNPKQNPSYKILDDDE